MMECKQAAKLMSQAQDRNLTFNERISLKFHLLICSGCTQYNRQMDFIRKAMKQLK